MVWQFSHSFILLEADWKSIKLSIYDIAAKEIKQFINDDWGAKEPSNFDTCDRQTTDGSKLRFNSATHVPGFPIRMFVAPDSPVIDEDCLRTEILFEVLVEISKLGLELERFEWFSIYI